MKNLDLLKEEKTKIQQRLMAAMKDGNESGFPAGLCRLHRTA